jgi:hypothetical protein
MPWIGIIFRRKYQAGLLLTIIFAIYYDVVITGLVVSGAGFVGRCNIDGQKRKSAILEESGHSSNFVGLTYPFTTLSAALSDWADTQARSQTGHCRA